MFFLRWNIANRSVIQNDGWFWGNIDLRRTMRWNFEMFAYIKRGCVEAFVQLIISLNPQSFCCTFSTSYFDISECFQRRSVKYTQNVDSLIYLIHIEYVPLLDDTVQHFGGTTLKDSEKSGDSLKLSCVHIHATLFSSQHFYKGLYT